MEASIETLRMSSRSGASTLVQSLALRLATGWPFEWHLSNVKVANIDRPEANPVFFFHDDWCKEDVRQPQGRNLGGATCRYNIAVHTSDKSCGH